jgi:hypothetical protein
MQGAGHSRAGGRQYPPPVNILFEPSLAGCPLPLQRSGAEPRIGQRVGRGRFARPEPERRVRARDSGPSVPFYRSADEARCAQRTEYLYDIATLQERALLPLAAWWPTRRSCRDTDVGELSLPTALRGADQLIRWAKFTMNPSGPRTDAMRQIPSY